MIIFEEKIMKMKPFCLQSIAIVKRTIKEYRSSKKPIIRLGISSLYVLWKITQNIISVCSDREFRYILLLQLLNHKNLHQTTSTTYMDRYPKNFSACRDYFNGRQDLKILSYGCSTGEEVLTLRKYFPTARIIGAEINKHSLSICKKLPVDNRITFLYSKYNNLKNYGLYDAIFCMAISQRTPHNIAAKGISSLKKLYPFEKFEQQIIQLDKLIKLHGLLIIHYTQYSLLDTVVAPKYKPLGQYCQDDYMLPVFDKNSKLIKNPASLNTIFIKLTN